MIWNLDALRALRWFSRSGRLRWSRGENAGGHTSGFAPNSSAFAFIIASDLFLVCNARNPGTLGNRNVTQLLYSG